MIYFLVTPVTNLGKVRLRQWAIMPHEDLEVTSEKGSEIVTVHPKGLVAETMNKDSFSGLKGRATKAMYEKVLKRAISRNQRMADKDIQVVAYE